MVGIYLADGTCIVNYAYDAWGNFEATYNVTNSLLVRVANETPFRYRGYQYDTETGLYYLNSRYYDAKIGRFINADSVIGGVGSSILGYNTFAYCFNNPTNMTDGFGRWPSLNSIKSKFEDVIYWVDDCIIQPVVGFGEDVVEDFNNYDTSNESEEVVFSSNYFSNYNGALVIKTPFDASFSFGFIGLSSLQQDADTLNHEYGHILQFENMGVGKYTVDVAIPSVTINLLARLDKLPYDYYSYPWEAEANELGGATFEPGGLPQLPQGEYNSYWSLIPLFFK